MSSSEQKETENEESSTRKEGEEFEEIEVMDDYEFEEEDSTERMDFRGKITKGGAAVGVSAVGGAVIYAFGIVILIAVLMTVIIGAALYLKYR